MLTVNIKSIWKNRKNSKVYKELTLLQKIKLFLWKSIDIK